MTAYEVASRFLGLSEKPGKESNPLVLAMLRLDAPWVSTDETPWCAAFVGFVAFVLGLPRSKSLAARSWLDIGESVSLFDAAAANDVVVLKRGSNPALGHVGFFAGRTGPGRVIVLGGNQSNAVTLQSFDAADVLGVRRLASEGRA